MGRKIVNDAVAYIRSLAELRGRNADWAERAVRQGASLPAREAAERQVVDFVADSVSQLLAEADGRTRSEEHTSELQSLMRSSYAAFCLQKTKNKQKTRI